MHSALVASFYKSGLPLQTPGVAVIFARDLLSPALISCPFCHCPLSPLPLLASMWGFGPSVHSGFQRKEKKGKGRDFASLSEALSPCSVHFTQQCKCYRLAVRTEPCIENICILTWHSNSIIIQAFYRHAEGFRKWIFEKLVTANLYCLQI